MNFLKPGITFEKLDIIAYEMSDNEWAKIMRKEHEKLYKFYTEKTEIKDTCGNRRVSFFN